MENRELTKTRVRNLMDDIPKEFRHRRMTKVRNTMKRTFSGMNTLLGQLAHSKTDKIRAAKKRKKNIALVTACIVAVIVVIVLIVVFS
jgi:CHASE3 domain sensor protein